MVKKNYGKWKWSVFSCAEFMRQRKKGDCLLVNLAVPF